MIEVRFHGRGGQGTVIASRILAQAAFLEEKHVQSFPEFGVERRGAPVTAFLRISSERIYLRTGIHNPDILVILEQNLINLDIRKGLKENGWIILNKPDQKILPNENQFNLAFVNATSIATENKLGTITSPIVNTAMVGAFAAATELVKLDSVIEAIRNIVPQKIQENMTAAKSAFEQCKIQRRKVLKEF